ncbi:hypothetical protein Vretimale_11882 [Volvox reticuliferus]|uniref:HPP transmembrane region domain-containing protein n=1 Tax=Volvox reticuliferus TaxID=1737510 RepID=A0A8J4FSE5_9CHLO|nr:hypothetical protein Vretifemale_11423 [Volvox reticuliferus]GIM07812.1 hypothetical protein Vretimale_11882 [Volvox reticuliferus]
MEGTTTERCDLDCANEARLGTDQTPENVFVSRPPIFPEDGNSRSQRRSDLMRRALTSPWRRLAPPNAARAGTRAAVERSCHALGAAARTDPVCPASLADISVPQRMDRRSASSAISHRSLFNIDGLPEAQVPDPSIHFASAGDSSADVRFRSEHAANVGVQRPQQQKQLTSPYMNLPYKPEPYPDHAAMDPSTCPYLGQNPPQYRPTVDQLQPPQPPQRQQLPLASSTASGTGLLGSFHNLLLLPGGADAFVQKNSGAAASAMQLLLPQGDGGGGSAASASVSTGRPPLAEPLLAALPQAAAPPPLAATASQLGCDDIRNPMSFNYNPSLDPPGQQTPLLQQQQEQNVTARSCGRPLYDCNSTERGGRIASSSSVKRSAADSLHAGNGLGRDGGRCGSGGIGQPGTADANVQGSLADPPCRDGDDVEVVSSDGPFVVLEMKGPHGTPSTRAAAAIAFHAGASASPAAPDAAVASAGMSLTLRGRMASYFSKWAGVGDTLMPAEHPVDLFWSWLGAFLSILVVAVLNEYLTPHVSLPLMVASFGASAVLLFGVPASKLAQPRNFLGGQVVSAIVGVLVRLAFMRAPHLVWLSAALGMSLALAAMQITRTVHPPGGASALIAASAMYIGPWYGFKFILTVFFGCLAMLVVALVVNNLSSRRRYPTYWVGK